MGCELEGEKAYSLLNIKKLFIFETESDHVAMSGTHCIDQAGLEVRSTFLCLPNAGINESPSMCHCARQEGYFFIVRISLLSNLGLAVCCMCV